MSDETKAVQAECEVLPAAGELVGRADDVYPSIVSAGYVMRNEEIAVLAIERWYATHFHAAAVSGRTAITAEDKASLIAHVTEALTQKE